MQEIVNTSAAKVSCNGGGGVLGHPLIYLKVKPGESEVVCPYCSRKFVLEA